MDAKERLLKALKGDKTDRLPCICPGGMMNMVVTELMEKADICWPEAHTDAVKMADLAKAVYDHGCFENYGVPFCMTIEAEQMGAVVDLGSSIYEPHVTGYAMDDIAQWQELPPFDPYSQRAVIVLDAIKRLKKLDDGVPIIGNLSGPISVAASLLEPVDFYKALRRRKTEAHGLMEFVTDALIRFGKAQIEAGADVIAISDPSGTGEILGPRSFDEFVVPYVNKLIAGLRETHPEIPVIVHICGKMHKVYDQLIKLRADAHSFDSIVSIKEAKTMLPGKVIVGNVSTYALEFADEDRIRVMTQKVMADGSDIIAPACGLGTKSSLKNIQAMLQTVQETGYKA
ncbi:uroporphyrinogen-III decarboxylase [Desulfosporosinus orientis DSM 765]|uniref:Uroporphyrinogen-III decarboxylase n=1 Tax=Desulfosporosinus orientis (strain ATCC 19365 / DSM 765 / NCIMB 8382 / VKM B-1628 / Singapore I) TaxID=768706 RepID=G7WD14_DESOD|nr:methylcobamide--CoM methyltransferase [Desulfosporosinus orientis]AET67209.1 uroporphyrinogen-III decarboxylase [Desulfosporosinus orientis DSM 765]